MTITYSLDISSSTIFSFHRLLFRWRGSIWKLIYPELIIWLILYSTLSCTYRYALSKENQMYFFKLIII